MGRGLSDQQKAILIFSYKRSQEGKETGYWAIELFKLIFPDSEKKSEHISVCNSLRKLTKRGLIKYEWKGYFLTDEGEKIGRKFFKQKKVVMNSINQRREKLLKETEKKAEIKQEEERVIWEKGCRERETERGFFALQFGMGWMKSGVKILTELGLEKEARQFLTENASKGYYIEDKSND